MGYRQREKSDLTKKELMDAMVSVFLQKGYEEAQVKEIAEAAGYSVGSFYRHWKSKQQAFLEFWNDYISDFIRGSVENAPRQCTAEEMIAYLIQRSESFSQNEITIRLFATSRALAVFENEEIDTWSARYTAMLVDFIRQVTPCRDERRLLSAANILHAVLDTHAMQHVPVVSSHYSIDNDTMGDCLTAILSCL